MKKLTVIVLATLSVAYAGYVDAATPKKRTRSSNRIGAYGGVQVGYSSFAAENSAADEEGLENTLINSGAITIENLRSSSEDTDIGYQAAFGYRFHRYFAAELGLAQFGEMSSTASADMDFDDGAGVVPVSIKVSYRAGGPIMSAIGILPLHEKFELFARLGYMFTSSEREFSARIDGQSGGSGSAKGDSQDPVYGVGFAWHINQVYSIRGEFQKLDSLGQENRTGEEDLSVFGLGLVIRF
ncbi:MAG TPA: outer membrane beta-barrel protein [Steroidobacteraceae bacterium]|nr:outer membrane beta-barrel protein [Steroidobacteraceae bacterium]